MSQPLIRLMLVCVAFLIVAGIVHAEEYIWPAEYVWPRETVQGSKAEPVIPDDCCVWLTAEWCGPCQTMQTTEIPKLRKLGYYVGYASPHWRETVKPAIILVDVDEYPELAKKYLDANSKLPNFSVVRKGKRVKWFQGGTTADYVHAQIK